MNTENVLPAWVSHPEIFINWIMANQMMIMMVGGVVLTVFFAICLAIGLRRKDTTEDKKKDFGKSTWAEEKALRKDGFLSKDL